MDRGRMPVVPYCTEGGAVKGWPLVRRASGEARKRDAHALLEAQREVYVLRARRALLKVLLRNGSATADDIRAVVVLPDGIDPKPFGCVPGALPREGMLALAGFGKKTPP